MKKLFMFVILLSCNYLAVQAKEPQDQNTTVIELNNESGTPIYVQIEEWLLPSHYNYYMRKLKKVCLEPDQKIKLPIEYKLFKSPQAKNKKRVDYQLRFRTVEVENLTKQDDFFWGYHDMTVDPIQPPQSIQLKISYQKQFSVTRLGFEEVQESVVPEEWQME